MTDQAEIQIESIEFDKRGKISFSGFVEGQHFSGTWNTTHRDFLKIMPKEPVGYKMNDPDGLCNAAMDDFFNLHWLIKIGGNIRTRVVRLEEIIKDELLELYHKNQ